ncbi:hypothetical protein [Kineococcus sp. SYSU DK004]|uniref:hypothetical protein n=1 Tax=Kineococcus sp. SYSU DK004 TaxID=3383125 RepID=UPI003D7EA824
MRAGRERVARRPSARLVSTSGYQALATLATAASGALFWVLAARSAPPEVVGTATVLVSAVSFLALAALLGTPVWLVRAVSTADGATDPVAGTGAAPGAGAGWSRELDLALGATALAATVGAIAYLLLAPSAVAGLEVLRSPAAALVLVGTAVALTVSSVTDAAFVGLRATRWNLLLDGLGQGGAKLAVLLGLTAAAGTLDATGMLGAVGCGAAVSALGSLLVLRLRCRWRSTHRVDVRRDLALLRRRAGEAAGAHGAHLAVHAPTLLVPLVVLAERGAAAAGVVQLSFTAANVLFGTAYAVTAATLAEAGSAPLRTVLPRAGALLAVAVVPAAALLAWQAPAVLRLLGEEYAATGVGVLVAFALSAPCVAALDLTAVVLRARGRARAQLLVALSAGTVTVTAVVVGLAVGAGLAVVGAAWALGALTGTAVAVPLVVSGARRPARPGARRPAVSWRSARPRRPAPPARRR